MMTEIHARTIAGFTQAYGPSRAEVYRLLAAGKLSAVKAGRITLILESSAQAWLATLSGFVSVPHTETQGNKTKRAEKRQHHKSRKTMVCETHRNMQGRNSSEERSATK